MVHFKKWLSYRQGGFQSRKKWQNTKLELECQRSNVIVSGFAKKERLVAWHFALRQVAARGEDWTDKRKQIGSKQGRWWASAWVKHWTELSPTFFLTHCITHFIPAAVLVIYIGTEMSHKLFHINNRVTITRGLCMQMLGGVYSGNRRCCSALLCSHVGR